MKTVAPQSLASADTLDASVQALLEKSLNLDELRRAVADFTKTLDTAPAETRAAIRASAARTLRAIAAIQ
jgi:hypothetical protein